MNTFSLRFLLFFVLVGMLIGVAVPEARAQSRSGVSISIRAGGSQGLDAFLFKHWIACHFCGWSHGHLAYSHFGSCPSHRPVFVHYVSPRCTSVVPPRRVIWVPTIVYVRDGCRIGRVVGYRPAHR